MEHDNINNQFFTTYVETEVWLKNMDIENYSINANLTINVDDNVWIDNKKLDYIPVQFGIVNGYFHCGSNQLTSLKGCPIEVNGSFDCSNNKITSLKGSPQIVGQDFYCYNNPVTYFSHLEFEIKENIYFTPIESMGYLDYLKDNDGDVYINFEEFKKLQALQKLNEKLNDDLSVKTVKIKHKI